MKIFLDIANAAEAGRDTRPGIAGGMAKSPGETIPSVAPGTGR